VLGVGVVAALLIGEKHAGAIGALAQRRQPVLGIHEDRAGVRRERLRHRGLELGERCRRGLAALLTDLPHERAALVHRGRADDAAIVGAGVDALRLALRDARSGLFRHLRLPLLLLLYSSNNWSLHAGS